MTKVYEAVPLHLVASINIRIIELLTPPTQHSEADSLITCRMHTVSLDDLPLYTALSYTRGDEGATESIVLNKKTVNVRRNLHDFLQEAQRRNFEGSLWIDALCIDQSKVSERNHQVAIMG